MTKLESSKETCGISKNSGKQWKIAKNIEK